jgi:hypothetical protein
MKATCDLNQPRSITTWSDWPIKKPADSFTGVMWSDYYSQCGSSDALVIVYHKCLHGLLRGLLLIVPDRRCRVVPEVVLVRRGVFGVLGIWKGKSWGGGGSRGGQFTSNLRARWTGRVTARRVPSKWKRVERGDKRGSKMKRQGEIKSKGNAPCIL